MNASEKTYRRGFLRRVVGTAAAASASIAAGSAAATPESKLDD